MVYQLLNIFLPVYRRSGASSSCSSYYSTSAAKAQLLTQLKDFADDREKDDDELTYKVLGLLKPVAMETGKRRVYCISYNKRSVVWYRNS